MKKQFIFLGILLSFLGLALWGWNAKGAASKKVYCLDSQYSIYVRTYTFRLGFWDCAPAKLYLSDEIEKRLLKTFSLSCASNVNEVRWLESSFLCENQSYDLPRPIKQRYSETDEDGTFRSFYPNGSLFLVVKNDSLNGLNLPTNRVEYNFAGQKTMTMHYEYEFVDSLTYWQVAQFKYFRKGHLTGQRRYRSLFRGQTMSADFECDCDTAFQRLDVVWDSVFYESCSSRSLDCNPTESPE